MKETLKNLKKKITLFAVVMLALQPVLGLAVLPAKTYAGATPTPGQVVINEVAWAGSSLTKYDEWLELKNTTGSAIDISGWTITKAGEGTEIMVTIPAEASIPANGYYLISNYAVGSDSTLNVVPNLVDSSVSLSNTNLELGLYDGGYGNPGVIRMDVAGDGSTPLAGSNATPKASMERNQVITDGAIASSWHTASTSVGFVEDATEKGTPGSVNSSTDVTPPVVTGVENGKHYNDNVTPEFTEGTATLSMDDGAPVPFTSETSITTDGDYVLTVIDSAGNSTVVNFTIDKTPPEFTSVITPEKVGVSDKTVKVDVNIKGFASVSNTEAEILGDEYDVQITVTEKDGMPDVSTGKANTSGKYHFVHTVQTTGQNKSIPVKITVTDKAGNITTELTSFMLDNLVLSPVVPPTSVVTAAATVVPTEPVVQTDQVGSSSDQGEVKADTTIKKDDQKPSDNNDQKTETKDKKNIPLWGIIFLLILAGIGGYLFYSQSPEKSNGKK